MPRAAWSLSELRVPLIDGQLNWDEKQVILAADLPLGTIPPDPEPRPKQHGAGFH